MTTVSHRNSSVAQWQSMRLLTAGLLVRVQPGEQKGLNHQVQTFFCLYNLEYLAPTRR